jgi:hypothetical protein
MIVFSRCSPNPNHPTRWRISRTVNGLTKLEVFESFKQANRRFAKIAIGMSLTSLSSTRFAHACLPQSA